MCFPPLSFSGLLTTPAKPKHIIHKFACLREQSKNIMKELLILLDASFLSYG